MNTTKMDIIQCGKLRGCMDEGSDEDRRLVDEEAASSADRH